MVFCRSDKKTIDLTKPMKMGAFVDVNRTRKYSEDDYILPETPPFSWLLLKKNPEDANNNSDVPTVKDTAPGGNGKPQNTGSTAPGVCNKENEGVKRSSTEEQKAISTLLNSQRPSRWSVSPTLDEEKFLKELVSGSHG